MPKWYWRKQRYKKKKKKLIQISIAYAKAIFKVDIITKEEYELLVKGLNEISKEWSENKFVIKNDEDIHSANERRLNEIIGEVSGKLHTGRSRNDQVAVDIRLWLRDEVKVIQKFLKELISIITERASKEIEILMPGYTHLQRAQPIRWSHWLLSYGFMFQRDSERLEELSKRINICPLGSGALAGNPFGIDRYALSEDLGFDDICYNSLDGTTDRDFIVEFLFFSSLLLVHISKIAEDLIIYSTKEFAYVQLSDAYSTGSSLMPQKKNPDSAELLRGKSGRAIGNLTTLLIAMKGLPSTYNKDMQEDKEPLFDSVLTVNRSLQILSGVLSTLKVNSEKMKSSLSYDMLATDLAEYLVRKKVPFRETHHVVGAIVKKAEDKKCNISELTLDEFKSFHKSFDEDVKEVWSFEKSVESRSTIGGTAKSSILKQIEVLKKLNK